MAEVRVAAPVDPITVDLDEVEHVRDRGSALVWMHTPDARRRDRLWMAVGMLTLALRLPASDALALLRTRAYATGQTADDLAEQLIDAVATPASCTRIRTSSADRGHDVMPARCHKGPAADVGQGWLHSVDHAAGAPQVDVTLPADCSQTPARTTVAPTVTVRATVAW